MGIYEETNRLFMKRPKKAVSWTTFIDVFDNTFWIGLTFLYVGVSIVFYVIFLFVNNETTISIGTSFSTVFLSSVALSIPVDPVKVPGRILVFSVCLGCAVVFWAYNAGLVSLLTVDNYVYPIK